MPQSIPSFLQNFGRTLFDDPSDAILSPPEIALINPKLMLSDTFDSCITPNRFPFILTNSGVAFDDGVLLPVIKETGNVPTYSPNDN